ncbi:MAG TPA: hypothetical protein VFL76_11245 [Edaphocola sp.]|nr:hypothetical protein [Edaphocola sp.]
MRTRQMGLGLRILLAGVYRWKHFPGHGLPGWNTGNEYGIKENTQKAEGSYTAQLIAPPKVPPAIDKKGPQKVIVNMIVKEKTLTLVPGVEYTAARTFSHSGAVYPGTGR